MKHFLDIMQLSREDVTQLLFRANQFKNAEIPLPSYANKQMATLFFENSTRTRISFEIAAKKLGLHVIHFDGARSSQSKGETIDDTMRSLIAMGVELFVVRHSGDQFPHELASKHAHARIINAGDGCHQHPSQAMLDLMTILSHKNDLSALKVVIVGDIKHSRVAHSLQQLLALMQVKELVLVTPDIWRPIMPTFAHMTSSLREGLSDADVIICLRIQHERLNSGDTFDLAHFRQEYALTESTLTWAKQDALVMHPGPINRGVEIDSSVADGTQSCIFEQVKNGVFMRMAILEALLNSQDGC